MVRLAVTLHAIVLLPQRNRGVVKESVHSYCRGSVSVCAHTSGTQGERMPHAHYLKSVSELENSISVKLSIHRPNQLSNLVQLVSAKQVYNTWRKLCCVSVPIHINGIVAWLAQEPPSAHDLISTLFAHVGSALTNHFFQFDRKMFSHVNA